MKNKTYEAPPKNNFVRKENVFRDMMQCNSRNNQRFAGAYRFHHQSECNQIAGNVSNYLVVSANVALSTLILFTLTTEAICSSETLVFARATWLHIPEEIILHSHRQKCGALFLRSS
jgi:hypothetical protein